MKINRKNKNSSINEYADSICIEKQKFQCKMQKVMEEKRKKCKSINGIKLVLRILYVDPANQIIEYSNNNRADLIVMGSKNGLQDLVKFIGLGSISRKISEAVSPNDNNWMITTLFFAHRQLNVYFWKNNEPKFQNVSSNDPMMRNHYW